MKIVIVGDGKVGSALTVQLARENHDVVVIDSNKMVLEEIQRSFDVSVVHGNGATWKVQKAAGVDTSDLLIAATSADETNILCCIVARKLGCRHTIARVRNPEYYSQLFHLKEELGLNMMINPESATANEIFRLLQFPSFLKRDSFAKGRVEIVEVELREGNPLIGAKLYQLAERVNVKVLVCAVTRGSQVFVTVDGNFQLEAGDRLSFTASSSDLAKLIRNMGLVQKKVKNVMIIGGSRIAFYLAENLMRSGVKVKLIEIDRAKCEELADALPKAVIINADGTDKDVLDSEGLADTDAVVTLTDFDEENLIVSMYANYLGSCKVITKINRTEYSEVLAGKGIDCVVSLKDLCSNEIVRYVRAMSNKKGESVLALHRIVGDRVEALEFRADDDIPQLGKTLTELRLKPSTLIACLNRGGRIIIPGGSDTIEKGDTVIVVTDAERIVNNLSDIFAEE